MSLAERLGFFFLSRFSKPAADRPIYRLIRQHKVRAIVEIGMGNGVRTMRMLRAAQQASPHEPITYAGIDLFEMGPGGVKLKDAYRTLKATGAKVRLIPGQFGNALPLKANELTNSDLIIISADQSAEPGSLGWFYMPRMLHESTQVLMEERQGDKTAFRKLSRLEIEQLAARHASHLRAA